MLTGCSGDVPMIPADDANNPACADVIVRLPSTVDGLDRRYTNAQSTGAWGDPQACCSTAVSSRAARRPTAASP